MSKEIKSIISKTPQELEERILKSIFKRQDCILDIVDVINQQMFTISDYGNIYQAMIDLYRNDDKINADTVQLNLEEKQIYINPDIINKLFNETYTSKNVKEVAEILKRIYQRRFILEKLRSVLDQEEETPSDSSDLLDKVNTISLKANEILVNGGENVKCCDNVNQIMQEIQLKLSGKFEETGLKVGMSVIDNNLNGLKTGNLWTICADSQVGKSMFALELAVNACELNPDIHTLYYSLEMTRQEQEQRALGMVTGIEPDKIENPSKYFVSFNEKTGELIDNSKNKEEILKYTNIIKNGLDKLHSYNLYIDDTPDHNIQTLEASIRKHHLKYGRTDLIIVDHMNILCSGTVSEEVGKLKEGYATLKKIAKKFNCTVLCLHQFSNELKNDELRKPNVFNLIGGGAPRHFSDVIVGIWRPGIYREVVEKYPKLKDYCDLTWQKVRGKRKPEPTPMKYNGFLFKEKTPDELKGDMVNGEVYISETGEIVIPKDED